MTKQECAVIMAHTGITLLKGKDSRFFNEYVDYLFDRHLKKSEIKRLSEEIKEKSREDFETIMENAVDMEAVFEDIDKFLSDDIKIHDVDTADLAMLISCVGVDDDDDELEDDVCDGESCPNWKICDADLKEEYLLNNGLIAPREKLGILGHDNVNHPKHYQTESGIEAIDLIEAFTSNLSGIEAVCTGNVLKYMCRWNEKNGIEDVRKAEWYIKKLLNRLEKDGK